MAFTVNASEKLEVHFIDVGQADAMLIKCEGHNMLIDGGNADDSQLIYTYLKNQGISYLDYIVNTHGDEDHVGGIPGAMQLVGGNIGTALAPYTNMNKERFQVFANKLKKSGKQITVPKTGDSYKLGSAGFQILSVGNRQENQSIVLRLEYGNTSFLFTGDADENQEKEIISAGYKLQSDVLKIGHHGSDTSTCYQFLKAVNPEAAVISVGRDNTYGHPTDTVLSRLKDSGADVFRTDNNGTIIFCSDGKNIKHSTEKSWSQKENLTSRRLSAQTTGASVNAANAAFAGNTAAGQGGAAGKEEYVLNTSTGKFHYPYCKSVKQMKDKNKKVVTDTRENLISQGYEACKNCNP